MGHASSSTNIQAPLVPLYVPSSPLMNGYRGCLLCLLRGIGTTKRIKVNYLSFSMNNTRLTCSSLTAVFMEWLGNTLGFTSMEHWHRVKASDFITHGAAPFIQQFGCSPYLLLSHAYPYHYIIIIPLLNVLFDFIISFILSLTRAINTHGRNGGSHA